MLTAVSCKYKTNVGDVDRLTAASHWAATSPERVLHLQAAAISNPVSTTPAQAASTVAKFKMTKRGLCSRFMVGAPLSWQVVTTPSSTRPTTSKVLNSGSGEPRGFRGSELNFKTSFNLKEGALNFCCQSNREVLSCEGLSLVAINIIDSFVAIDEELKLRTHWTKLQLDKTPVI